MSSQLTDSMIARQSPEAQGIIRALLAEIFRRAAGGTGRVASAGEGQDAPELVAAAEHAAPARQATTAETEVEEEAGRPTGAQEARAPARAHQRVRRGPRAQAERVPQVRGTARGRDSTPLRHQVWELPEIKPHVTEYRRHRLSCADCGELTCAKLPSGVPQGQSGPRLVAFTALLMAYYRQSKRRTAEFLAALLGQPCCPGSAVKMQRQATAALRGAYDELVAQLPKQDQLSGDETATKEENRKAWLWTFVARKFTVFALRATREATAVVELLTAEFTGVVTCDRAKMYWCAGRLQWCWAHLKRDFQALIDGGDGSGQTTRL